MKFIRHPASCPPQDSEAKTARIVCQLCKVIRGSQRGRNGVKGSRANAETRAFEDVVPVKHIATNR